MVKLAVIGALAPLLLLGAPVRADWRTPIAGAQPTLSAAFMPSGHPVRRAPPVLGAPILPSRFIPMGYEVIGPPMDMPIPVRVPVPVPAIVTAAPSQPEGPAPAVTAPLPAAWSLPLVDRDLTLAQRTADLAPELLDAIGRIEPMYDPTRLDGPDAEVPMVVSPGTATMDNVFADRWRLASPDANINRKTVYLAAAWQATGALPCDAFFKNRPHGFGDPALTALSVEDCRDLRHFEALAFDEAPPVAIIVAPVLVPVFAAPLPGSRMSSQDFWAQRKARIMEIQAHLHDKWRAGQWPGAREQVSEMRVRP